MHAEPGRFKNDRVFYLSSEALAKEDAITKKRKEVAMKMLMVIMLVRAVIAYIETATNKNKKNIRNDADATKAQHPAETMLR